MASLISPIGTYLRKHWIWLLANIGGLLPLLLLLSGYTSGRWIDPVAEG